MSTPSIFHAYSNFCANCALCSTEGGNPVVIPLGNAVSGTTPLLRILADLLSRDQIVASALLDPPLHVILLSISPHLLDHDAAQIPRLMFDQKQLEPTCSDWLKNWQLLLFSLLAVNKDGEKEDKDKEKDASQARGAYVYKPLTRKAIMGALKKVFLDSIVDFPSYRTKLARLVFDCWVRLARDENEGEDGEVIWKLLGEEVFRSSSSFCLAAEPSGEEEDIAASEILSEMNAVAETCNCSPLASHPTMLSVDEGNGLPSDVVSSPSPHTPYVSSSHTSAAPSGTVSPVSPRTYDSQSSTSKEGGSSQIPQFMSLLSFTTPVTPRNQISGNFANSQSPDDPPNAAASPSSINSFPRADFSPNPTNKESAVAQCRGVIAVVALVELFLRLAFDDSVVMSEQQAGFAIRIFGNLVVLLRTAKCARARLIACQALMRLRADRDHKVYFKAEPSEDDPHVIALAASIERLRYPFPPLPTTTAMASNLAGATGAFTTGTSQKVDDKGYEEFPSPPDESRRSRPKQIFERDGRRTSRGRGSGASDSTVSRSRSRAAGHGNRGVQVHTTAMIATTALSTAQAHVKRRGPGWLVPDVLPFSIDKKLDGKESQLIVTFLPSDEGEKNVLPVSQLMDAYVEIIKSERDWDILSFVLVHLPSQLANKHYWCGPLTRESINNLLNEICRGIDDGSLGKGVFQDDYSYWSGQAKAARDAQMLAFNTLSVLTSYQTIFETSKKQTLVKVFQAGLSGIPATVKCCLHALSLCAFEMQVYITKDLPQILEKLSQIMTNPSMAVHILTFLSIVASQPSLHSSFTENDFKTVFAVALQYLQHHNRPETIAMIPFALAQHVRIISYYVVYVWFLALKLSDRPQHIKFITRQLLLANEERDEVDAPTEVCFDWLARYTYGSADPKPASSLLDDILSTPAEGQKDSPATSSEISEEKSWIVGYSLVTIKKMAKPGWLEVTSRRASGTTKFLCRNENVPLVDIGDVNPDMITIPSIFMMNKNPERSPTSQAGMLPAVILPRDTSVDVEVRTFYFSN